MGGSVPCGTGRSKRLGTRRRGPHLRAKLLLCVTPGVLRQRMSTSTLYTSSECLAAAGIRRAVCPACARNKAYRRNPRTSYAPNSRVVQVASRATQPHSSDKTSEVRNLDRRYALLQLIAGGALTTASIPQDAHALVRGYSPTGDSGNLSMPGLAGKDYGKAETIYRDYVRTPSGLQYQDIRIGSGKEAASGSSVVVDWDGYTIGYYGRVIEARNLAKGGDFNKEDHPFLRFEVGKGEVIRGIEEAVEGMKEGGIRRIIVPPGDLSYPFLDENTQAFDIGVGCSVRTAAEKRRVSDESLARAQVGPVPSTFSGQRTLDFVLKDRGLMDKTLLFDIELMSENSSGLVRRGAGKRHTLLLYTLTQQDHYYAVRCFTMPAQKGNPA
eukprot:scaffold1146_cov399-Prasinococcus_capsulatus_cf.AAC.4